MAIDVPTAPAPPHPQHAHQHEPRKRMSRKLIATIAAGALGVVGFGASRLLSSGEDPSLDKRPVAVGPAVPGTPSAGIEGDGQPTPSAQPTPESTQEGANLSPLEKQAKLFERVGLPASALTYDDLAPVVDPHALDIYKGVDGGMGLYPTIEQDISSQRRAFGSITPEDIEAELNRLDHVVTGTHLDVVDDKLVTVPNTKLMEGGEFRQAMSKDTIKKNTDDLIKAKGNSLEIKSAGAAGTLANAGDDVIGLQLMSKMLAAEARVAEYYVGHPDEEQKLSDTTSATLGEATFLAHGDVNSSAVINRIEVAREMLLGQAQYDPLVYDTARVAELYELPLKTADGKKNATILGAAIVGQTQSGKSTSMYVAMIPAEKAMGVTPDGKFALQEAPEGTFNTVLIGKFIGEK
jgi:hypothetical protein